MNLILNKSVLFFESAGVVGVFEAADAVGIIGVFGAVGGTTNHLCSYTDEQPQGECDEATFGSRVKNQPPRTSGDFLE